MKTNKIDLIVDMQYGSTGKGLFAGWLATTREYDVVMNANMPNAGHTYIDQKGNKMIHKVLPSGVVSPNCRYALIGPGAVFDIDQLTLELDHLKSIGYDHFSVLIHPNSVVLNQSHVEGEALLDSIGSTKQGSSEAMIEKMRRNIRSDCLSFKQGDMIETCTDGQAGVVTQAIYRTILKQAKRVLAEGAQGYSLGINQPFWPYTTSRECTPTRFMSDMMIPLNYLDKVYGVARVHPIRVGGSSGPAYDDQLELTWYAVGQEPELTTVTKKQRRIFTFSYKQMDDAIWECCPDGIFLNFVNYDEDMADQIIRHYGELISWVGVGPNHDDVKPRRLI
jgi:adenylosuccinate synthase